MSNSRDIIQKTLFWSNMTFECAAVTLKIRPGPPKSNQVLTLLLKYIYASLVKTEPPIWKIV